MAFKRRRKRTVQTEQQGEASKAAARTASQAKPRAALEIPHPNYRNPKNNFQTLKVGTAKERVLPLSRIHPFESMSEFRISVFTAAGGWSCVVFRHAEVARDGTSLNFRRPGRCRDPTATAQHGEPDSESCVFALYGLSFQLLEHCVCVAPPRSDHIWCVVIHSLPIFSPARVVLDLKTRSRLQNREAEDHKPRCNAEPQISNER